MSPKLRLPVHGRKILPSSEYSGLRASAGISSVKKTVSAIAGPKLSMIRV
jgi:hypothetical protein